MEAKADRDVTLADDEAQLDPEYKRLTEEALRENQVREEAERTRRQEEERRKAAAPPPLPPEKKAENLKNYAVATFLHGAGGKLCGTSFDIPTHKVYLDAFLEEAGAPTDPVERLLLEQLLLAHHSLGRLLVLAGARVNLAEVTACLTTAARLMGECRRSGLALQNYRDRATARKPMNRPPAKHKPRPEAAPAPANAHGGDGLEAADHSEEVSKNRLNGYFHANEPAPPEPSPCGRWPQKPSEARAIDQ